MKTPQDSVGKTMDELVEERLISMIKENAPELLMFFVVQAGRAALESNAEELTLSSEATINGQRYKFKNVTTYKKIKPKNA